MEFEHDPEKSRTNKTKHGLDFEEAKQIWEEFDRKFDAGEDTSEYVAWSKAKRPGREQMTKIIHEYDETKRRLLEEAKSIDEILSALQRETNRR